MMSRGPRAYARWLWLLLGLFVVRVAAQPIALHLRPSYLPSFEAWHSGAVPYPLLVASQLLIVVLLVWTAWRVSAALVIPRHRTGVILLWAGGLYFSAMILRLALGSTILSGDGWFDRPLPTFFHLVLASYLMVYGLFHVRHGSPR